MCTNLWQYRLQVDKHSSGNMLLSVRLAEGVQGVVPSTDGYVGGHLLAWQYAVLQRAPT